MFTRLAVAQHSLLLLWLCACFTGGNCSAGPLCCCRDVKHQAEQQGSKDEEEFELPSLTS